MLHDKLITMSLGFLILLFVIWVEITSFAPIHTPLQRLDHLAYDLMLKTMQLTKEKKDTPIIIVDIDEKSLRAEGRWPWPRNKIANLIQKLQENFAVVIAFDITFSKPEINVVDEVLPKLLNQPDAANAVKSLRDEFDNDSILAEQLKQGDVVLGVVFDSATPNPEGSLPPPLYVLDERSNNDLMLYSMSNYRGNLSLLQDAAKHGGFITTIPDSDGIIRRLPLVLRYENGIYPSLGLEAARLYLLADKIEMNVAKVGNKKAVTDITLGKISIPTDAYGQVLVPYRGPSKSFEYFSATDILHGKVPQEKIENSLVFVGTTALGLADLVTSPLSSVYPGVEVHANVAAGILENNFPYIPDWEKGAEIVTLVLIGMTLILLFPFLPAFWLLFTSIGFLLAIVSGTTWLYQNEGIVLSPVLPLLLVTLLSTLDMTYGFLFESRRRVQLKLMFGKYVSPEHVDEMSKDPKAYGVSGESKNMTVLFADIRNFTTISESLSAQDLQNLLNRFFTPMTEIIFDHGGTIDKYVGDMLMAFWNAPLSDEQHAQHAIDTALAMQAKTKQLQSEFEKLSLPEIDIGIGISTGEMTVGDMGSEFRLSYTVIGDTVNLGSRLESLTKYYGVGTVVSDLTKEQTENICYRKLDRVRVKGKKEAVKVYEPIGYQHQISSDQQNEILQFEKGLGHYFNQAWDEALEIFNTLNQEHPDSVLYQLYLNRTNEFKTNPPSASWDGVTIREEK